MDVWEKEPDIDIELLKKVLIATPHIAGYSYEGKVNGTKMVYESLCKYLDEKITFNFKLDTPPNSILHFEVENKIESALNGLISKIYSIINDNDKMKKSCIMNMQERIEYFDLQRKNYPNRREFDNYSINSAKLSKETKDILEKFRFRLFI